MTTDLGNAVDDGAEAPTAVRRRDPAEYLARAALRAYALGRRLNRDRSAGDAQQAIVTAMATCVGAQYGALAVFVRKEGVLRIAATYGYPQVIVEHIRVLPGEGLLGRVFTSGKALFVGGEPDADGLPRRRRYRTQSCILIPLNTASGVLGVVAVADPRERGRFAPADVRALRLFVPTAALALEREALREDVAEASETALLDYVTGLANRQYLQIRLPAEMKRAERLGHPLAVMLVDVDNFKQINDICGHLEGDRVLRDLGVHLSENVRSFDVCTRYGGEEFAIVMPGAEHGTAIQIAERVRKAVEHAYMQRDPGRSDADTRGAGTLLGAPASRGAVPVPITVSAGLALMAPGDTANDILRRADGALLRAKADGKNVVRSD